jgi:uncharacterized protein (DUF1499 family)
MGLLRMAAGTIAVVAALTLAAGQAGLFGGTPPADLGVRDGRLAPPSATPNSVSSQVALWPDRPVEYARIEPVAMLGDGPATIARIRAVVEAMPGARVIEARPDYLYAQFTTRWMKFVDDTEFWYDPAAQVVQVRSASRVGRRDFGVNRARVESIRAQLGPAAPRR